MILPNGAKPIAAARANGKRPAEMVIVSLIGLTQESNHTVYANPRGEYDWRWAAKLKVCIYTNAKTPWRDIAMGIARSQPEWLGLWDVDAFEGAELFALPRVTDIEKPSSQWKWELHAIVWLPFQNREFAWGDHAAH